MTTAIDTDNIVVGSFPDDGGVAYTSFKATATLPTTASGDISTDDFESLGDLSEDGFTEGTEISSNDFNDCKGHVVLTVNNTKKRTVTMKFIEATRDTVLKLIYGTPNVTVTGGKITSLALTGDDVPEVPLVIEQLWTNGWKVRYVLNRCKITSYSDVPHNKQNLLGYEVQFTLQDDDGVYGHVYYAEPATD